MREENGALVPTYPRAKYYVQKGEWELAHNDNARARGSYRLDDFEPLAQSKCLKLVNGNHEVVPGVSLSVTGGHTGHHQVVTFASEANRGIYFADIVPTKSHLAPPWVMGYDHFPLESCDVKSTLLKQAASEGWLVVFDHETGVPWGRLNLVDGAKFEFAPLSDDTLLVPKATTAITS